jgi:L-malate glycosyltransferase
MSRRPIRVAFVLASLRAGGAERVVVHLASGLRSRGAEAAIVCLQERGDLASQAQAGGARVEAIRSLRGWDVGGMLRLRRFLRAFRPDAINVHDRSSLPYVAAANWLAGSRPVVYTAHGLLFGDLGRPRLRYCLPAQGFSAMTAVSPEAGRRHARRLRWRGPVHVIANGLPEISRDPALREAARKELGVAGETFVFLAVGNARPEKGFEDLLSAAGLLKAEGSGGRFAVLVAGRMQDEAYSRRLLDAWDRAGLHDDVRFLGFRGDVQSLYSAADAFVLPSRSEGLPMALLEAMMAGLPVVATRVGGVPAVLSGGEGLLAGPADPRDLAGAMRRILDSEPLRRDLSARGASHARADYGVERMCEGYLRVFERVLASRSGL